MDKLYKYIDELKKWNEYAGLIQERDICNVINRHIIDCLQLCSFVQRDRIVLDIGSGAGLPGFVLGMCGYHVLLSEINEKKRSFLRHVSDICGVDAYVCGDVYKLCGSGMVAVSRAFGSLSELCDVMCCVGVSSGVFLKGKKWCEELSSAYNYFDFSCKTYPSMTNNDGVIICLDNVVRR